MIISTIASLAGLLVYIGVRLSSSKAENEQLRLQVASLKRQLRQGRFG